MTPIMLSVRRGTASGLGLRTPYSRPRPLRLRPMFDDDVEYMIARFKESLNIARYRTVILGDRGADGPPRPIVTGL